MCDVSSGELVHNQSAVDRLYAAVSFNRAEDYSARDYDNLLRGGQSALTDVFQYTKLIENT